MLKLSYSELIKTSTRPLAAGVTTVEEGVGLIAVRENGIMKVKPSVGGANTEEFAGFAVNERTAPPIMPQVVEDAVVTLLEANKWGYRLPNPVVGVPRVVYGGPNGTALTEYTADGDSLLEAGEYKITGNILEVVAADLGKTLYVVYNYAPTIQDLMYIGGDNSPTTFAPITSTIQATGVIETGTVFTSKFDPTINWHAWTPAIGLKLVANGIVTTSAGTGAVIKGRVIEAPSAESPFLGIDFTVAA